jgi:hypothetical protein
MEVLGQIHDPFALPQGKERQPPFGEGVGGTRRGLDAADNATFVIQHIQSVRLICTTSLLLNAIIWKFYRSFCTLGKFVRCFWQRELNNKMASNMTDQKLFVIRTVHSVGGSVILKLYFFLFYCCFGRYTWQPHVIPDYAVACDTCSQEVEVQPESSEATGFSLKIIREIL